MDSTDTFVGGLLFCEPGAVQGVTAPRFAPAQPCGSMHTPSPDFTLVLTFMLLASFLLSSSIRIDGPTRASLYLCFDFHFDDSFIASSFSLAIRIHAWTTAVRIHGSPTACFDIGFDLHVDPPN